MQNAIWSSVVARIGHSTFQNVLEPWMLMMAASADFSVFSCVWYRLNPVIVLCRMSRQTVTDHQPAAEEQHQESTGRPVPTSTRHRRPAKVNNHEDQVTQRHHRSNGHGAGMDQ